MIPSADLRSINAAFSRQSATYDDDDLRNPVLQDMRKQVYAHVARFIRPNSSILELNAGTGIDAVQFVEQGHRVHATDLSDGMIKVMETKLRKGLTVQHLSYDDLTNVTVKDIDFVFSNLGGLNCISDLRQVTDVLKGLLKPGALVTWTIMPVVAPWELLSILKGRPKAAFRRFHKQGVRAHLEGEHFTTYYHSLKDIKNAFGSGFELIASEALCIVSPPPHRGDFPGRHPRLFKMLRHLDLIMRNHWPFNRWGDHVIVTFRRVKSE